MGDPVDQTLSPYEEKLLGEAFMNQIRANMPLISDPELNYYLQNLGNRLATSGDGFTTPFTFFIVQQNEINAFAAPGGYIGVNSGLIFSANYESQLAAVIAHEIAHVKQRHIARAQSEAYKSGLTTAASILAAIVLGSQGNTQESQAALYGGIAASQQLAINFTRANEHEADRIGMQILADSGYTPAAMAEFFAILQRKNDISSQELPEYLRTHPLNNRRIAEAKDRAAHYTTPKAVKDSLSFQLMRKRLRVKSSSELPALIEMAKTMRSNSQRREHRDVWDYTIALALGELRKPEEGLRYLLPVLHHSAENIHYLLASAELSADTDEHQQTESLFKQLFTLYPTYHPGVIAYARYLMRLERYQQVLELLRRHLRESYQYTPEAYSLLAQSEKKLGNDVASREALAEYHRFQGELPLAIKQLQWGMEKLEKTDPDRQRIEARLQSLKRRQEELEQ